MEDLTVPILVAYDIGRTRTRTRVANALLGCGVRLQRSVFLLADENALAHQAIQQAARLIDPHADALGAWRLCRYCLATARWWGTTAPELPGPCVVVTATTVDRR